MLCGAAVCGIASGAPEHWLTVAVSDDGARWPERLALPGPAWQVYGAGSRAEPGLVSSCQLLGETSPCLRIASSYPALPSSSSPKPGLDASWGTILAASAPTKWCVLRASLRAAWTSCAPRALRRRPLSPPLERRGAPARRPFARHDLEPDPGSCKERRYRVLPLDEGCAPLRLTKPLEEGRLPRTLPSRSCCTAAPPRSAYCCSGCNRRIRIRELAAAQVVL